MNRFIGLMFGLAAFIAASFSCQAQPFQGCYNGPVSSQILGNNSCLPAIQAAQSASISISSATTTQLIALAANQAIFVTNFNFMAAGTLNVTMVYGTGTNCGTGQITLTGAYPLIAQAGISAGVGVGPVLVVPQGNALCIITSGSSQVSGSVSYVQF